MLKVVALPPSDAGNTVFASKKSLEMKTKARASCRISSSRVLTSVGVCAADCLKKLPAGAGCVAQVRTEARSAAASPLRG